MTCDDVHDLALIAFYTPITEALSPNLHLGQGASSGSAIDGRKQDIRRRRQTCLDWTLGGAFMDVRHMMSIRIIMQAQSFPVEVWC